MIRFSNIKIPLLAFVCFSLSLAGVMFLWLRIQDSGDTLRESLAVINEQERQRTQQYALTTLLEDTKVEREELGRYVLQDDADAVSFLLTIDNAAARLNVELQTQKLEVHVTETEGFDELFVHFTMQGSEAAILRMLALFETLPYHSSVRKFHMQKIVDPDAGSEDVRGDVEVVLSIVE